MKSLAIVTKLSFNQQFLGKRERVIDQAARTRFMEFEKLTHQLLRERSLLSRPWKVEKWVLMVLSKDFCRSRMVYSSNFIIEGVWLLSVRRKHFILLLFLFFFFSNFDSGFPASFGLSLTLRSALLRTKRSVYSVFMPTGLAKVLCYSKKARYELFSLWGLHQSKSGTLCLLAEWVILHEVMRTC